MLKRHTHVCCQLRVEIKDIPLCILITLLHSECCINELMLRGELTHTTYALDIYVSTNHV